MNNPDTNEVWRLLNERVHYEIFKIIAKKVDELRRDLEDSFKIFYNKIEEIIDLQELEDLDTFVYALFDYMKDSFFPHQNTFSEICIEIFNSSLVTDEIDDIIFQMQIDLENIFWSKDYAEDAEVEYVEAKNKIQEIRQSITTRFLLFDRKLVELTEKLNSRHQ